MGDLARSHARDRFRTALNQHDEEEHGERAEARDEAIHRLLRIAGDVQAIDEITYDIAKNPDEIDFPGGDDYPK
jgi:hypothetical protein